MVAVLVVMVLALGIFSVGSDRTRGPLLESGQNLQEGLEGGRLLLKEPGQRHGLELLLRQGLLKGLES